MGTPGFNADLSLGPSLKKYRSQSLYKPSGGDSLSLQQYDMDEIEDLDDEIAEEEELEELGEDFDDEDSEALEEEEDEM